MFKDWKQPKDNFSRYADVPSVCILAPESPMAEPPFLSIMIPTFRRADLLDGTIKSAIKQQNPGVPYEIIVLDNDDEGNEATVQVVQKYVVANNNVYYYRNSKNLGMFGNWNRSFELARGAWVAMLHDDDRFLPHYVNTVSKFLPHLQAGVVGVFPQFMEEQNGAFVETPKCVKANRIKSTIGKLSKGQPLKIGIREFRRNIAPNATGCLFKRECALATGGFNETVDVDYTFYDTVGALYGAYIVPQMLTVRGISSENLSNDWETVLHYAKVMRQFTLELGNSLPHSKAWVADYSATSYLNSNKEKYSSTLPKKELCKKIGISSFWANMPNFVIQILQTLFWLQVVLDNK